MGGKNDGGSSAPQNYANANQQFVPGSFDPNTGQPFANPGYQAPAAFEFPEFHMPDYGAQQADYADQLAQQQADAQRNQGLNDRDSLYSNYVSAASSATDYINQQINQEQANASLLGIDYNIDDDSKATRISDYFASIWGEGDQLRLEGLFGKWGKPQGFDGWTLERGDASNVKGGTEGGEESIAKTKGRKPTLATGDTDEVDNTLGSATLLGG